MVKKRNAYRISWESQKGRYHQEGQEVGGWIILKGIIQR
jgi:hypothetical protein